MKIIVLDNGSEQEINHGDVKGNDDDEVTATQLMILVVMTLSMVNMMTILIR